MEQPTAEVPVVHPQPVEDAARELAPAGAWLHLEATSPVPAAWQDARERTQQRARQIAAMLAGVHPTGQMLAYNPTPDQLHCQAGLAIDGQTIYAACSSLPDPLPRPAPAALISGVCLGSARATQLITATGRVPGSKAYTVTDPVTGLTDDEGLTLAEYDSCARLALLLRAAPADAPIMWVIPRVTYYLPLLDVAWRGLADIELVRLGCARVDASHMRLQALARGMLDRPSHADAERLERVGELIHQALARGGLPRWETIVATAAEDEVLGRLIAHRPPRSGRQLAQLAWSAPYLRAAAQHDGLLLAVEDPREQQVLREARQQARALYPALTGRMAGLYPTSGMWVRTSDGLVTDKFWDDPGRRARTTDGRILDLAELALAQYGAPAAHVVEGAA
ncbi:hypothetical protein ACIBHX_46730 [Nonomuraea sp. NPDC050536]|uniref:hypothetical protein n=1 Tax=Nonomuraea sp. NPDC050536 TaxID=3364366 RepID=UPI0037CCB1A7